MQVQILGVCIVIGKRWTKWENWAHHLKYTVSFNKYKVIFLAEEWVLTMNWSHERKSPIQTYTVYMSIFFKLGSYLWYNSVHDDHSNTIITTWKKKNFALYWCWCWCSYNVDILYLHVHVINLQHINFLMPCCYAIL